VLFFLPVLFFVLFAKGQPESEVVSVFNRNSFAGFTLSASALLLGFGTGRQLVSLPAYVAIVSAILVLNTTLGALLAFLLAVLIYVGPSALMSRKTIAGFIVLGAVVSVIVVADPEFLHGIETFERLRFISGTFSNLYNFYSGSWTELDMATAVRLAPSGDLDMSAVFRILHWIDIVAKHASDGVGAVLFGSGTDWVEENKSRFTYTLAAHNEYIRLIVEQGLLHAALIFFGLYGAILMLRRSALFIPLFALTVFLASENLLNNFVTTALYFFSMGHAFAEARSRGAEVVEPVESIRVVSPSPEPGLIR
jgi:hypothetical protein